MITSLGSKCVTSGYHHGRLITSWRERAFAYFGLLWLIVFQICNNDTYCLCIVVHLTHTYAAIAVPKTITTEKIGITFEIYTLLNYLSNLFVTKQNIK